MGLLIEFPNARIGSLIQLHICSSVDFLHSSSEYKTLIRLPSLSRMANEDSGDIAHMVAEPILG